MRKKGEEFISLLDKERTIAKFLWRVIVVQSIVIVLLAVGYFNIKETARVQVELPSKLIYKYAPVVVAGIQGANKVYYRLWAEYLTKEIANFDYTNIDRKLQLFLETFLPQKVYHYKKLFMKVVKTAKENYVKQTFTILSTKFMSVKTHNGLIQEAVLKLEGESKKIIGESDPIKKECSFTYKMRMVKGVLYVEDFATDCF